MTASTAQSTFPIPLAAGAAVIEGAVVCVDTSHGYGVQAADGIATLVPIGVALESVNNTLGAHGARTVQVRHGMVTLSNEAGPNAVQRTDVGAHCWISGASTVSRSSLSGARSPMGRVICLTADGVLVALSPFSDVGVSAAVDTLAARITVAEQKLLLSEGSGLWTDILGEITQGTSSAALAYEAYRDTPFKFYFMQHNQADELHFKLQTPHSWDPRSPIRTHLHFTPMANGAGTFALRGYWAWSIAGVALGALSTWNAWTASVSLVGADWYVPAILPLFTANPPVGGAKESSRLLIYAVRDLTPDTYQTSKDHGTSQANICLEYLDAHYQVAKAGTVTEIPA